MPFSGSELEDLRRVAVEAASLGSRLVARAAMPTEAPVRKGVGDYVTEVDRESEEAIRGFLEGRSPGVPVLGEEEGGRRGDAFWAVDPLDGTTNFLIGLPVVGVSVALVSEGEPVAGAIQAPFLGLSFSAAKGGGAWAGSTRLSVSDRPSSKAIVATGFPLRHREFLPRYLPAFHKVLLEAEDLRRPGAASLDLAWVASGVFDGFFELNLGIWDVAAGALLVREAGGVVTDWSGGDGFLSGHILAGSPQSHRMLLDACSSGDELA